MTLKFFTDKDGEEAGGIQQNLVDLLCNLAHYCDRKDLDMSVCLMRAKDHYDAETDHEGHQFSVLN